MKGYLTNGQYYIKKGTDKVAKTLNVQEARIFGNEREAKVYMDNAPGKTKGYIFKENKNAGSILTKPVKENKVQRKQYSEDVKRLLYLNSNGKCAICGEPLLYDNITLDHRVPLKMGGADTVENLQISCLECNRLKGSLLTEELVFKLSKIVIHQLDVKYKKNLFWIITRTMLKKILIRNNHGRAYECYRNR